MSAFSRDCKHSDEHHSEIGLRGARRYAPSAGAYDVSPSRKPEVVSFARSRYSFARSGRLCLRHGAHEDRKRVKFDACTTQARRNHSVA